MDTPNLDRLVAEGIVFGNVHINAPVCAPARASLFSGFSPHNTGVQHNDSTWPDGWVATLAESGYYCVNIGKMHTGPYTAPFGFDERYVVENKDCQGLPIKFFDELDRAIAAHGLEKPGRPMYERENADWQERMGAFEWPIASHLHPDEFVGDTALWWLDQCGRSYPLKQPRFLEIGFPGPHPPFDPLPELAQKYMQREFPLLEVTEAELDAQPEGLKRLRQHFESFVHDSIVHDARACHAQRQRQRAYYIANCEMIDRKVGQIIDRLDDQGLLQNSVMIFTSNHGESLGDHGLIEKWNMYDCVTRVPTIVWGPERFDGARGVDDLYSWFDLGPTILQVAEIEPPPYFEAISMLPHLLGAQEASGREAVFCEAARDRTMRDIEYQIMMRTRDYKCVEFLGEERGQLYDLAEDPDELPNLWDEADRYAGPDPQLVRSLLGQGEPAFRPHRDRSADCGPPQLGLPGSIRDEQHFRDRPKGHDLGRITRGGDRRSHRRLPAAAGALAGRHPTRSRPAPTGSEQHHHPASRIRSSRNSLGSI